MRPQEIMPFASLRTLIEQHLSRACISFSLIHTREQTNTLVNRPATWKQSAEWRNSCISCETKLLILAARKRVAIGMQVARCAEQLPTRGRLLTELGKSLGACIFPAAAKEMRAVTSAAVHVHALLDSSSPGATQHAFSKPSSRPRIADLGRWQRSRWNFPSSSLLSKLLAGWPGRQ